MKRSMALLIALLVVAVVRTAGADPLTDEQRKALALTDEAGDAWLHDHCSFRGVGNPSIRNASVSGQVVELIDNGQSPLAKEFRCADRPPFWKGSWSGAPEEAVSCRETKPSPLCVPPLRPPPAPVVQVAVPLSEPPPVVAPPPPAKGTPSRKVASTKKVAPTKKVGPTKKAAVSRAAADSG